MLRVLSLALLVLVADALRFAPPAMQMRDQVSSVGIAPVGGVAGRRGGSGTPPAADSSVLVQGGSLRSTAADAVAMPPPRKQALHIHSASEHAARGARRVGSRSMWSLHRLIASLFLQRLQ